MSVDIIKLKARLRTGSGKSYTRKARQQGWVPAIYYGEKKEPVSIEIDNREFAAIVRGKKLTHLINLGIAGEQETSVAVIRDVQRHVIKDDWFLHIDFQRVAMDKSVTVDCPVELVGIPVGVKDSGGVLGHPIKRVKIECMPTDIPDKISIDVSQLKIGDSIHFRDVVIPNITIKAPGDEVVAVVTHPTREEETVKPAEEEAGVAEPTEIAPASGAAPAPGVAAKGKEKAEG
jgi:large subunit ribosomal protein L25